MRLLFTVPGILLWAGLFPVHAETLEYDIEIAIFEDAGHRYLNSETWPRIEHAIPLDENTPDFIVEQTMKLQAENQLADTGVAEITDIKTRMLNGHVAKLRKSSQYNVLLHKAWRQAGLDAASAIDVEISSLPLKPGVTPAGSDTPLPPGATQSLEPVMSSIAGSVKITLGRYLHIYTDLIYRKPAAEQSSIPVSLEDPRYHEFLIKTHRRMRSKELHYLDHPLVGILVMALPVEVKTAPVPQPPAGDTQTPAPGTQ